MVETQTQRLIHCFEEAGLGIAPFSVHLVVFSDWSTCEFCGTAIKEHCYIQDSKGKIFLVGNECVKKTGDAGLVDVIKREVNRLRTEARHKKEAIKIEEGQILIKYSAAVNAALKATPHPYAKDKSLLDALETKFSYSGNKGKIEVTETVKEIAKTVLTPTELQFFKDNHNMYVEKMEAEKRAEKEARELEHQKMMEEGKARRAKIEEDNKFILDVLYGLEFRTDFVWSMITQLKDKAVKDFSPRQKEVLCDIYGKTFGRRNSKEYQEGYNTWYNRIFETKVETTDGI